MKALNNKKLRLLVAIGLISTNMVPAAQAEAFGFAIPPIATFVGANLGRIVEGAFVSGGVMAAEDFISGDDSIVSHAVSDLSEIKEGATRAVDGFFNFTHDDVEQDIRQRTKNGDAYYEANKVDTNAPSIGKEKAKAASAGAADTEAAVGGFAGGVDDEIAAAKELAANPETPVAERPDAPTVSNKDALVTNASGGEIAMMNKVAGAKLPMLQLSEDGKTVITENDDDGEEETASLAEINAGIMEQARSQQENQTSNDGAMSFQVQTSTGETVVVTKNPCYQKSTQSCMQNYNISWTDDNGDYHTSSVPLNTQEYLAGSTKITADMIQQARRQESFMKATTDAFTSNNSFHVNPIESVTSSVRDMVAHGADPKEAIMSGIFAYASQLQSADTIKNVKEYGEGKEAIQKAKDDAVYARTEEIQQKNGVLSAQKNKRFRPRIIPDIPVINSGKPIKVSLVTSSGKPNDEEKYMVYATVTNQKTKKQETFAVKENTPFIVELPEWTKTPGKRTVVITYEFANSAVKERYSFSYNVGQLYTAILPNGKAVSNSVTALASNRDILSYNMMGQAVAGRVKDVKWDNGMCFMEMSDAKDDGNIKYPSVVVGSDKVEQSVCNKSLVNKYVSMGNVTAQMNEDGQYVYVDNSDGDQVSVMDEAGYDSLENEIAAYTQSSGNKWDKDTLVVSDDGTIYNALPGQLGVNYLNLNVGSGKKVNIAVSVNPETGSYVFSKADGTRYTEKELISKGINPEAIAIGMDTKTSLLKAYDKATMKVISNDSFDASDTSNLSRIVAGGDLDMSSLNTDASLTRGQIRAAVGDSGSRVIGQAISTFSSMVTGATKAVTSIQGNLAMVADGTFASINAAGLGNDTALSSKTRGAAEREAIRVCQAVPDRCDEIMDSLNKDY